MVKHRSGKHQIATGYASGQGMEECLVQSFSSSIGQRFFRVDPGSGGPGHISTPDATQEDLELFESLLGSPQLDPDLTFTPDPDADDSQKLSLWLNRTGWIQHLGHVPLVPLARSTQLDHLHASSDPRVASSMRVLGEAFDGVWASAEGRVRSNDMSSTLALLKTPKQGSHGQQDIAPFKVHEESATRKKYCGHWKAYFLFCCRWQLEANGCLPEDQRVVVEPALVPLQWLSAQVGPDKPLLAGDITQSTGLRL